jgi:hypothetical protein
MARIVINTTQLNEIFFLRNHAKEMWLGMRKRQTKMSRYSIVEPSMLLGKLKSTHPTQNSINFNIEIPEKEGWQHNVFELAADSVTWDLHFPYAPRDENGSESICPATFWETCADDPVKLDQEETHFREYTVNMIGKWLKPSNIVYDPACSTGAFLNYVMTYCPEYEYIASDACNHMISLAKKNFPRAFVADTRYSQQLMSGCDVIICRFLNHEVMSACDAELALVNIVNSCKASGKIIIFGHTPVAIDLPKIMKRIGAKPVSTIGKSNSPYGIFQYYVYEL